MTLPYLLDTNAYHLFFNNAYPDSRTKLEERLKTDGIVSFYISEITSMEIYSVLGKDKRGAQRQEQVCKREIENGVLCTQNWFPQERKSIKNKIFRKMLKLVSNIQDQEGPIKADILPLDVNIISQAKAFLIDYADKYNFGAQDALIAATAITYSKQYEKEIIVVTSDKGLKAALGASGVPCFDPLTA